MTGRIPVIAAWTAALALALFGLDRLLLTEPPPPPWSWGASLGALPTAVGPVAVPSLPPPAHWHADTVRFRTTPAPAWWVGWARPTDDAPVVWVGAGALPPELERFAGCFRQAACPPPWTAAVRGTEANPVFVLSRLDDVPAGRVELEGLPENE